jgi:CrcB protein
VRGVAAGEGDDRAMLKLIVVTVFGGIGSLLRYQISGWCQRLSDGSFPVGTLAVNLIGCAVIGFCGALFLSPRLVREEYRIAVMVGLLGGFTTFSTYAWESFRLLDGGEVRLAVLNLVLSNALGFVAVWFAYRVGVRLFGA